MLDQIKAWWTRAKLLWTLAVLVVGATTGAVGHCHAWATIEPRVVALEADVQAQKTAMAEVRGYVRGIAAKVGARPIHREGDDD
jgi:hypothetical protein